MSARLSVLAALVATVAGCGYPNCRFPAVTEAQCAAQDLADKQAMAARWRAQQEAQKAQEAAHDRVWYAFAAAHPHEAQEALAIQRHNLAVMHCVNQYMLPGVPFSDMAMHINTDIREAMQGRCGDELPVPATPVPPQSLLWSADGRLIPSGN